MPAFKSMPLSTPLKGTLSVPGDKSVSHRALILGGMSVGRTRIVNLLEGDDVLRTAAAMRALGCRVATDQEGAWLVDGCGVGGFAQPHCVLDQGNSGTGVRLLLGVAATLPFVTTFAGDESLSRRPMRRVTDPLEKFGATFTTRDGQLPITVDGALSPVPVRHGMTVASAQVKSAILLAGLNAPGETTVIEAIPTRDHTERMLRGFGADISTEEADGGIAITLTGQPELTARDVTVPADPSSAAFFIVAATLIPDSDLTIENISLNPHRIGLIGVLQEMGADITVTREDMISGEPVGDVRVCAAALSGIDVAPDRAPSMIDEYPILAVAAAAATGTTTMRGLEELRVKESDRIGSMARGLVACGVDVDESVDSLVVHGRPDGVPGGGRVATSHDHRIAMAFSILGLASKNGVTIDDDSMIATSFPNFTNLLRDAGAEIVALNA